jgi:hypothetical protein
MNELCNYVSLVLRDSSCGLIRSARSAVKYPYESAFLCFSLRTGKDAPSACFGTKGCSSKTHLPAVSAPYMDLAGPNKTPAHRPMKSPGFGPRNSFPFDQPFH